MSEADREPLLDWLPTLCFYNVRGAEQVRGRLPAARGLLGPPAAPRGRGVRIRFLFQVGGESSFHNEAEAAFTLTLVQALIAGGVAGAAIGVMTLYRAQVHKVRVTRQGSVVRSAQLHVTLLDTLAVIWFGA